METELSENIKKIIDILLQEIELQNRESINGIFLIHILSKKFTYLEDLDDIWRIVEKINEKANKWVLSVVSKNVFNSSLSSDKTGGPDELTEESIIKLHRAGTGNESYLSLGFEKERYFYFVIEDIEKLKEIKNELSVKNISITYSINIGQFIFNEKDKVSVAGKQKDTANCLVDAGKDVKISWDEIYEKFKDSIADQDIPNTTELDSRKRSVRTAVAEINNHTKEYLEPNKELIDGKSNEYWLQYKVEIGR